MQLQWVDWRAAQQGGFEEPQWNRVGFLKLSASALDTFPSQHLIHMETTARPRGEQLGLGLNHTAAHGWWPRSSPIPTQHRTSGPSPAPALRALQRCSHRAERRGQVWDLHHLAEFGAAALKQCLVSAWVDVPSSPHRCAPGRAEQHGKQT